MGSGRGRKAGDNAMRFRWLSFSGKTMNTVISQAGRHSTGRRACGDLTIPPWSMIRMNWLAELSSAAAPATFIARLSQGWSGNAPGGLRRLRICQELPGL